MSRHFYGRQWGTYGRATNAPSAIVSFRTRARRDAWVEKASGIPSNDCGARDALTADEVRMWYKDATIHEAKEAQR